MSAWRIVLVLPPPWISTCDASAEVRPGVTVYGPTNRAVNRCRRSSPGVGFPVGASAMLLIELSGFRTGPWLSVARPSAIDEAKFELPDPPEPPADPLPPPPPPPP